MDSKISNKASSSVYIMIGPLIIKLQLLIFYYLFTFTIAGGVEVQLSLQFWFFQLSHRQHLFLLAKFLYSHLSQYQSYEAFRSILFNGQQLTLYYFPFIAIASFINYFMTEDTYTEGYFAQIEPSLIQISSGTLVPALMLKSIKIRYSYYFYVQFYIFSVFVCSILYLDYCGSQFWQQFPYMLLFTSFLGRLSDEDEEDDDEPDEDELYLFLFLGLSLFLSLCLYLQRSLGLFTLLEFLWLLYRLLLLLLLLLTLLCLLLFIQIIQIKGNFHTSYNQF